MPEDSFHTAHHGAIALCTQAFGRPGDPAIVLVMGATASMVWWPDALCQALAAQGRFVVRFDHRDTGASTTVPPGEATYGVGDLADDVLAVLDAHGLARAHLVGMSLGAYVAQLLALRNPQRVDSLTLIAAEPLGGEPMPPLEMDPALLAHFATIDTIDWTDGAGAVRRFLERVAELSSSPGRGVDRPASEERIAREIARTPSMRSAFNHATVGGDVSAWNLQDIAVPTLVIHGAHDPIIPLAHGQAIARQIPAAQLEVLPEAGHELHTDDLDRIAAHIVRHTRAA